MLLLDAFDFGCFLPLELLAAELSFELPLDEAELSDEPDDPDEADEPEFADLFASVESEGVELPDDALDPESSDFGVDELLLSLGGGFEGVLFEFCVLLWLDEEF